MVLGFLFTSKPLAPEVEPFDWRFLIHPQFSCSLRERLQAISKIVRERRRMTFSELQAIIPASPATIRRDLAEPEESGNMIRVHGVMDTRYVKSEITFDERMVRNVSAKRTIGALAARLIPPGASVLIDAGTTGLEAGRALLGRKDVRIITHSVTLVEAARQGETELLCIGGELRKAERGPEPEGRRWGFSLRSGQISRLSEPLDWTPKRAARTPSCSRPN